MIVRAALTMMLGRGEARERGEREAGRQAGRERRCSGEGSPIALTHPTLPPPSLPSRSPLRMSHVHLMCGLLLRILLRIAGFLDRAEFHRACDIVNQCSAGTDLTSDQIEQLASAMDTDGDGKINFNEFLLSFRLLSENDTHLVGGVAAEHKAEEMRAAEGKAEGKAE